MPTVPTCPGVFAEELPSADRTIIGIPTAVAAFVGEAESGPVNAPLMIHSFGDFEREFGGLRESSPMSFAVEDYFLNGGTQALIVRVEEDGNQSGNLWGCRK